MRYTIALVAESPWRSLPAAGERPPRGPERQQCCGQPTEARIREGVSSGARGGEANKNDAKNDGRPAG